MLYSFLCDECGQEHHATDFVPVGIPHPIYDCERCGGMLRRAITGVNVVVSMQPHFNPTVGKPISSERQFRDELRRQSDIASENTGTEHRYVPVDLDDKKALGVTDEGLDKTARVRRTAGLDEPTKRIIV